MVLRYATWSLETGSLGVGLVDLGTPRVSHTEEEGSSIKPHAFLSDPEPPTRRTLQHRQRHALQVVPTCSTSQVPQIERYRPKHAPKREHLHARRDSAYLQVLASPCSWEANLRCAGRKQRQAYIHGQRMRWHSRFITRPLPQCPMKKNVHRQVHQTPHVSPTPNLAAWKIHCCFFLLTVLLLV